VAYDAGMIRTLVIAALLAACSGGGKQVEPALPPEAYDDPQADIDAGPDNEGELTMAEVEANMGPIRDAVKDCAATTTWEGKVTVQISIDAEGTPRAEMIEGSGKDNIDSCVMAAFDDKHFPTSKRGQRFKYSFTFK